MRVFLPATAPLLAGWLADRTVPAGRTGFAVTAGLEARFDVGNVEEMEDVALSDAARASLHLLDADEAAPRRRVVLAVEVPQQGVEVRDDDEPGAVRVGVAVPLAAWGAGLVDDAEAEPAVSEAAASLVAADLGSEDAAFVVEQSEGHQLGWYASQELEYWLAGLALPEPG